MQSTCPESLKTPVLIEQVAQIRDAFNQAGVVNSASSNTDALDSWLLAVCAVSPYITRTLSQFPNILPNLAAAGQLTQGAARTLSIDDVEALLQELNNALASALEQLGSGASTLQASEREALEQRVLRQFRHQHMVRILWCDLSGICTLEQTLYELSILAECCVKAADQWSYDALSKRFGRPCDSDGKQQRLIIIGMGKLGGYELNVSSDIDLICLYASSGSTQQNEGVQKSIDNGEFFRRSIQRLSKLLNSVTHEGFVYRVDTRLRPFGESGPPVMTLEGLENYYLTQARDWERYAMIKGRALCGLPDDIQALQQLITPFVYRRYMDYSAFDSLREIKRKIALSLLQKAMVDDIKLGAGGIREIEFIGQAFQLVRGGREPRLRVRSILHVLPLLDELNLLSAKEINELLQAYRYLRRVENALQMMRDEQTHCLPTDDTDRQRLLAIMDESQWSGFRRTLDAHQACVSACFNKMFESASDDETTDSANQPDDLDNARNVWAALSTESISDEARIELLEASGFIADEELLNSIATLSRGSFYQRLTAESQHRVERIVPHILVYVKTTASPSLTLVRMLALVRSVAGRSGYLQVLCDQPQALERLVILFSKSRWLAGFVARSPMVIDELLIQPTLCVDAQSVFDETQKLTHRLLESELDVQMDSMRHYRQAREMRIASAQLDGSLTIMQVSDQLSWLAESIIAGVLTLTKAALAKRFGEPGYHLDDQRIKSQAGVVAYGKLGGLELGFGSDLDLVFVHDSHGKKQQTDGKKIVDNALYYAKMAQSFVHFMSTKTPAGILYDIDLRLRPNGSSGVLVSGIEAFADYQSIDAWTWEHQALMRARMVFGSTRLRCQFDEIRQKVLAHTRSQEELKLSVANMRERMRRALGNSKPGMMHLKQDDGGVADIEFIVQYLVLAHSQVHPSLLMFTDNIRVLDTVEKLGLLPAQHCNLLRESYLELRVRLHRQSLDEASALVPFDETLKQLAHNVTALRLQILGEPTPG